MNTNEAWQLVGGLSKPSKMPGWAYGLPAPECKTGSILRNVENSTCSGCYAMKGCYAFPIVQAAQYKRLKSIRSRLWVKAMTTLINSKKSKFFRWHDSGDVQDLKHLAKIFEVCRRTPNTIHWMPTREAWTKKYIDRAPKNLIIRFSMPMIDQEAAGSWAHTSTVSSKNKATNCPAFRTDKTGKVHTLKTYNSFSKEDKKKLDLGHCGTCRKCWNFNTKNITYGVH